MRNTSLTALLDVGAAASCLPVVASAVDAWSAAVQSATAELPDEPTVDEFNGAWARLEASAAGELRAVLAEIAGRITDVITPPAASGRRDEHANHLTSH